MKNALIIGNTDGIGLSITKELLNREWHVSGISRRNSLLKSSLYQHRIADVSKEIFFEELKTAAQNKPFDLCIYCAGIGELLSVDDLEHDISVFQVNLMGMVKTVSAVIPGMVKRGKGHFIGLSSVADEMLSAEAPSYHASKAAFSNYLEGLGLALKPKGVDVTNIRFGFVDTKMAKGDIKPFMMSVDKATEYILSCMEKKPIRFTAPKIIVPLVKLRSFMMSWKVLF